MAESPIHADDYGERLLSDAAADVWWCDGTSKVGRTRPAPTSEGGAARISAARHEYEPLQIVVRPKRALRAAAVTVSPLRGPANAVISPEHITVARAHYVPVTKPTDNTGAVGAWPDPLIPVTEPFALDRDANHPLWVTVYVPEGTPAGEYAGVITLSAEGWRANVPLHLRVRDFTLPRETHVQSAFGFSVGNVHRYHRLDSDDELRDVVRRYHENFAAHRISPYDPAPFDPIEVRIEEGDDPASGATVRVDFSRFDRAAEKAFNELRFTSFRLPLMGLGGGTFHARHEGTFGGHAQGTPQYDRLFGDYAGQVEGHLAANGWLDKAYVYWFDEPEPKDFDFVKEGMENIHKAAPRLTRMLTEEPSEPLYGYVELWCPLTAHFDPAVARERKAAGERIWWYICTGPKAPYATLFIDHPATELRVWLWQTWKYGVDGILVWQSNYWTSDLAFPDTAQNPYEDPMSYQTGYGRPRGHVGFWGNGDGRFLYPPWECVGPSARKSLDGPVSSIRWEMLREGIEDYEYLWLLRAWADALDASLRSLGDESESARAAVAAARGLLEVPEDIVRSMTEFARESSPIYAHRERVAEAIERLAGIARSRNLSAPRGVPTP
jgi:hypothetical protein